MTCDGTPTVCQAIGRLTVQHCLWFAEFIIQAHKRFAVRVITIDRTVHSIVGIVIAALLIFRLVVDSRPIVQSLHLHFSGGQVALEILAVGGGIPEAPLGIREDLQRLLLLRLIGQRQTLNLGFHAQRNKIQHARANIILRARDTRIVQAVTTLIPIQFRLARLPAWIPDSIAIFYIEVSSDAIHRHAVVSIACDTAKLGVLVEVITACSIGNQTEKVFIAEVVDPRKWCLWVGDDIFAMRVVEMSVLSVVHNKYIEP